MSDVTDLIDELARVGISLEAHGGKLRYHSRNRVTSDQVDQLRTHKVGGAGRIKTVC